MQLIPLLLLPVFCLLVAEASRPGEQKNRPESFDGKDWSRHPFPRLSPEMTKRLARVEGPEQKIKLNERLPKTPRFERSEEDKTADLFEVNKKEGVAKFMYQGDMVLTDEQVDSLRLDASASDLGRTKRQVTTRYSKWTNNTVYYYFDSSLQEYKKAIVAEALQFLQSRTCIKFVQSSSAAPRIKVFNGRGCYSYVGMIGNPEQTLSLGDGCEYMRTAAHEFMHALGIWHTQMRYDRDDYVTINLAYVLKDNHYNFDKVPSNESVNYTPYEYGSVMHYSATEGSTIYGGNVMIPKDIDYLHYMKGSEPTFLDIFMINKHYGCHAVCPAAASAKCKNGGVPNVRNCSACMCPTGYYGTLCDQRPPGCGETLAATASWQLKSLNYSGNTKTNCTFWITALEGQKIEIQFVDMTGTQCQDGCSSNGVEIKRGPDNRMTYPKYCCQEFINRVTQSSANPTPLIIYNHEISTNFTFKYRALPAAPLPTTPLPTTKPPTTRPPTTRPPKIIPLRKCRLVDFFFCVNWKTNGKCTSLPWHDAKFYCPNTCGFCGKAASPCNDRKSDCRRYISSGCTNGDPMAMEKDCAKPCGYCERPN